MKVARSGYYGYLNRQSQPLNAELISLHTAFRDEFKQSRQSYGSRRMAKAMQIKGHPMGRYQARMWMKKLDLKVKLTKRSCQTTSRCSTDAVAINRLNQQFHVTRPNAVWGADITYLRTQQGWLYLAVVLDLFSRQVVGWALQPYLTTELATEALNKAFKLRKPEQGIIHHSDRGCQYTSGLYQQALSHLGMLSSMSRAGNCYDNAVVERFFRSLKSECTSHYLFETRGQAKQVVIDYILMFYNSNRLHSYLGYQSPMQYEQAYLKKAA
jgi:transposase InsO family protein